MNANANKVARVVAMAIFVCMALLIAHFFGGSLPAKIQGWLLASVTCIFVVSDLFFGKAIDGVSELPKSDALSAAEAATLLERVQTLKSTLIKRWFMLIGLKAVAGLAAALLINISMPGWDEAIWLAGLAMLVISFPIMMTFFRAWQQADTIKGLQVVNSKTQKEKSVAAAELAKSPAKPLKADKALKTYTKVLKAEKPATGQ